MTRRTFGAIAVAAVAILAPFGAASAQPQSHLRIGLAEDPDVLDPTFGRTYVGRIVFAAICDKLFDIDESLRIVPQLALSHETSDDGRQVTIRLRPGVTFHDGTPMDAAAVKFSLDRHREAEGSFRQPELEAVERVEVVDPLAVRLHLSAPFTPLLAQLADRAGMILSPKAVQEAGDRFGERPVCAGPYRFVERVPQDRIVVDRFEDYWNADAVEIERITYLPIIDPTVRLANLRSGDIDVAERLLPTDLDAIRADPDLRLVRVTEIGHQGIWINVGKGEAAEGPLGSDPRVREAFERSIDRTALNEVVFDGEFVVGNQWVSPEHPYYQERFPVPGRDVAEARRLLEEAGVPTPVAVDLMTAPDPVSRQMAEVIQAMAAEAGFDVRIRAVEFATSLAEAEAGRFQAYLLNWSGRADPDGNIYVFARSGAPQNYAGYADPEVDAWLEEARRTSGFAERKAIYGRVAEMLLRDRPYIYLFHRRWFLAHSDRVEGLEFLPDGLIRVVGLRLT